MKKLSGSDVKNNLFYQLPKFLFLDSRFRNMSNDSKILYSMYYDRSKLSIKNKWIDNDGNVYIYFTNKKAMELLNCRSEKLNKIKNELNSYGLIEEIKRGVRKANRIYVLVCNDSNIDINEFEEIKEILDEKVKNSDVRKSNTSCSKIEYDAFENRTSDIRKSNTSNTNLNDTNNNNNIGDLQNSPKNINENTNQNTNQNLESKQLKPEDIFFEEVWSLYPNKKGKSQAVRHKKALYKHKDKIKLGIERYLKDTELRRKDFPALEYKYGSTFFTTSIYEYISEDFEFYISKSEKIKQEKIKQEAKNLPKKILKVVYN